YVQSNRQRRRQARYLLSLELVLDPPHLVVLLIDALNRLAEAGQIFELALLLSRANAFFSHVVPRQWPLRFFGFRRIVHEFAHNLVETARFMMDDAFGSFRRLWLNCLRGKDFC